MKDYQPVDLSAWCNAGAEVMGEGKQPPIGRQSFHGLPFLIGVAGARRPRKTFIAMKGAKSGVAVPVGRKARRVIFAHLLLESGLPDDGKLGKVVAEYVFRLSDGSEERVPVRERYEISSSLGFSRWLASHYKASETPFCGLTSNRWVPQPRYEGRWEQAG